LAYQAMAPTGQWLGRTFSGRPDCRQVALTYDDGPNDPYTLRLVEVLAKHEVKATFFMIGRYVAARPDIVRSVVAAGHVVGNHTFTHPNLIFRSAREVRTELLECQRAIGDAVGEHSKLFRPPFGARRPATLRMARRLGFEPAMWNVTGYDWNAPQVESIERRLRRRLHGGAVFLLHDGGHVSLGADRSSTIEATDRLLAYGKPDGYQFVTLSKMMGEGR